MGVDNQGFFESNPTFAGRSPALGGKLKVFGPFFSKSWRESRGQHPLVTARRR